MKRMGYLKRVNARGITHYGVDGASPPIVLRQLRLLIGQLHRQRDDIYLKQIFPDLREQGVELLNWDELSKKEIQTARDIFQTQVFPILTPLAIDPAHPFPFLSNLSVSLAVKLHQPQKTGDDLFARVKIPTSLPHWIHINKDESTLDSPLRFVRLLDVISNNLPVLFPEMIIESVLPFRVTRNADIGTVKDDDAEDLLDLVEEELRLRRIAEIVRVEYPTLTALKNTTAKAASTGKRGPQSSPLPILNLVQEELELDDDDYYEVRGELDYGTLNQIASLKRKNLSYRKWVPVTPPPLIEEGDLFRLLRDRDILVHHPFDSFSASLERFVRSAVKDPNVLAIKITLYRAGDDSPLIPLLIEAAEEGKQVVVVLEVKARFDEAQNIYWGEILEKAGVHVVYGVIGLKTHSKITLVVRKEGEGYRFYGHIGTGNYNPATAKLYTDVGLFTSNPQITSEMIEIFNYLTGLSLKKNYSKFLVSPVNMRERFLELIQNEISNQKKGLPTGIVAKMNSLEDKGIIEALYEASQAGVKIQLIVRGFCCLRPQVKNLSENIQVSSIVGRFLEHSRIYYFRNAAPEPAEGQFYIGSADWMSRNLNSRVETIVPVEALALRKQLWEILDLSLKDQVLSWDLQADGSYVLRKPSRKDQKKGLHTLLMDQARNQSPRLS